MEIFGLFTETQKQDLNIVSKPQMVKCKLAMTINIKLKVETRKQL